LNQIEATASNVRKLRYVIFMISVVRAGRMSRTRKIRPIYGTPTECC